MPDKIECISCGKTYKWSPNLAGKRAKCKCGATIEVPAIDSPPDENVADEPQSDNIGIYDVTEPAPVAASAASQTVIAPAARVQTASPVLAYAPPPLPGQPRIGVRKLACCQACGSESPVKYVEFYQNVGALVVRFHRSIKGNLCKKCIHSNFWKMTLTTLTVGWLGYISIVVAPVFIIGNLIRYVGAIGLPKAYTEAERRSV